jgi:2-polyprenyl-6-methoxyphenol hydroxylase-like FAD-dependent oxidoreductase
VLVVGAGIAGSTAAALLGRDGHDVTLVERADTVRTSGAPVDVRDGAIDVARRLGVEAVLRAADTGVRRVAFVDRDGRRVAETPTRGPGDTDIEIARARLGGVLLASAADVADVVLGEGPENLTADDDGVDVALGGGGRRFDLVIGADGQHSTVRRLAWGPEDHYRRSVGLGIATVPASADVEPDVVLLHNEPGTSTGIHPAGGSPIASFIFRTRAREAPRGPAERTRMLRERYAGVGWRAGELLEHLDERDDVYFDVVARVGVPSWTSGRVTLLGDAASSVTILGEGSSMAMVGAACLADALREAPDVATALARYETAHRPVVARRQRGAGLGAAFLAPRTRLGITARDGLVRLQGLSARARAGSRRRRPPAPSA